jgi:uncharacterized membrane protein YbhN (UPF0104 family)
MTRRDAVMNSYPEAEAESFSSLGMFFSFRRLQATVTELDVFFGFSSFSLGIILSFVGLIPFLFSKSRTAGSNHGALFTLFVTGGPCRLMATGAEGAAAAAGATTTAAFGVFCWLEVTGLDFALFFIFLCFVLHITF